MDFGNRNARCDRMRIPSTRQSRERGLAHGHSVRCLAFACGVFFGNNRRHRGDPLDFHGAFCAFSGVLRPITVSVKLANPKEDRSAEAKQRCGSKESCSCAKLRRISREQRHSPTLHGTIQRWSSFQNLYCIFYLNSGLCKTPERLTLTFCPSKSERLNFSTLPPASYSVRNGL